MKARIYHENPTQPHYVTVEEDDYLGNRASTTYFCPMDGGYVRIADDQGNNPQVCDGLANRGPTLYCSDPKRLIDIIRTERKRGLRRMQ